MNNDMYQNNKTKPMRKLCAIMICICLVLVAVFSACGNPPGDTEEKIVAEPYENINFEPGSWAFYIYMCGSDLESNGGFATQDLQEMLEVTLPDNVKVIIEAGGSTAWKNEVMTPDSLGRYMYTGNTLTEIEKIPDANMSDSNTLVDFLRWANQNHPAEKQAVIFWNHGGGSLFGVISDERNPGDTITLSELNKSLAKAPASSGTYEMVGFDACLMATIETADILSNYSRFMVASEEVEPGCGWEYTGLFSSLAKKPDMNGGELGKAICDTFYAGCKKLGSEQMTTLSVIDLTKFPKLLEAYKGMGDEALINSVEDKESYFSLLGDAARSAENYGGNNDQQGYADMVDIGDLVRKAGDDVLPSGKNVLAALEESVVYQIKGALRSEASGLSCYYSYDGGTDAFSLYADAAEIPGFEYFYEYMLHGDLSGEGKQYVADVQKKMGGKGKVVALAPVPKEGLEGAQVSVGSDGHYVLDIGSENVQNIAGVYLHIVYYNYYFEDYEIDWIADLGSSHAVDTSQSANGIFSDTFDGKWAVSHDKGFEAYSNPIYLEVTDRKPGEYTLYNTPVLLNDEEYQLVLNFNEKSGAYEILGAMKSIDKESGMSSKELRKLVEGDIMVPIAKLSTMDYETGNFTPLDFIDAGMNEVGNYNGFILTDQAEFYDKVFLDGYYRVQFEMVDYAGKRYLSAPGWYQYEENGTPKAIEPPQVPAIEEK